MSSVFYFIVVSFLSRAAFADCADEKVKCYMQVYRDCGTMDEKNKCVVAGYDKCVNTIKCAGEPPQAENCGDDVGVSERKTSKFAAGTYKVSIDKSCDANRKHIEDVKTRALERFEECAKYAFLKPELVEKFRQAVSGTGITVNCHSLSHTRWCAAGGMDEVILPPKFFEKGGACAEQQESKFIHEIAHSAGFATAGAHNEEGEAASGVDEIYSFERYCMTMARGWITRAKNTAVVVRDDKLECVRAYQEAQVCKDYEPFWIPLKALVDKGQDPCSADALKKIKCPAF